MLSSDDILKTSQLITILLWIIPNLQVQCDDTSSELLPSYSLPNSILTTLGSSKEEKTSDIFIHFKDEPLSTETLFSSSVNLFTSFTQTQPESVSQQSSYFHSSPSIIFSQNNLQTNDPSISVVSSLVEAFISISMFNSLANIEDTNNSSTTQISQTEFISDDDSPIPDILSSYLQPLDEFFSMTNSLLLNSTGQILKSISAQQNLNDSIVLESFPVAKSKPPTKEQDINESKFDKLIYTSFTVVDSVNINNKLLDINSMYIRSFNQQSHIQLNSESQMDEIISESKIFLPMFTVKSLKSYISPSFHTKGKLLSDMHTVSHFDFTGKTYFSHRNIDPLSTLNDFTSKESTFSSTKTENLYRSLTVNFIQPMQSDESKTESILPYQYEVPTYQTKLFTLHPSETQIDEMESLYSINKNQMFLYSDPFLESHQSAISQSYSTSIKHSNKSDESLSDLKSSFGGDILSLVNDQTSSIFIKSNTKSHYSLQSNFLQKSKFIKPTMSQLISAYLDESQIIFDSNKLLYMSTSVIDQTPQEQTERKSSFVNSDFNFKKSFQPNLYQSILSLTQFNDKQSSLSTFTELLKSETSDIFNEHLKSKLESTKMKSSGTNLGYNSDDLSSPSLRGRNTVYILKPTQSLLQYLLQSLSTESGSIDVLGGEESSPLSNIEILDPSETVSLTNLEDFLLLTSQNIFQSIVSLGITNTDNLITSSSSEELFYLLNSVLSFSTEPSHSKELSQPYTYTYIPTTELLSEQSIASSQIKMLSSPQESVSPVLMKNFSSPNMKISSNSEHMFETSSKDLYSSVTTTETNVFSEGHERYVFGTLDPELDISTALKASSDKDYVKTQSYSIPITSSRIKTFKNSIVDSYSTSSLILETPQIINIFASLLPLTSFQNLISTSLTPAGISSNPLLRYSVDSSEIIEPSSLIDHVTEGLTLITTPDFLNLITSTSTSSQISELVSSTENGNVSISTSFYSSNSMNSVYDSSMTNVAVTEHVYDSSMTNVAVTNSLYDSSMTNVAVTNSLYDSSMTNVAVTNSLYDSSMTNVAVTNSLYDSSMTNVAVTNSLYDSSMTNAAVTEPIYDPSMTNFAVTEPIYDSSMTDVAVTEPIYDSSMTDVAVTEPIYDSSMTNVAVTEPVYDSSMTNVAVTNFVYDSSMTNVAVTNSVYDSSMTNVGVTKPIYDSSMTNVAVTNSVYDSSMTNVAVTKPVYDSSMTNAAVTNSVYDSSMTNVAVTNSVYDSSMTNAAVTNSVYDSSMTNAAVTNSVYDSSMINAAVTNSVTLNAMSSTLHPNTDVELGSTHLTPGSIYLYTSQTPIFVSSSFINENNSYPNTTSNMSDSNLFSASNLTLPSNQMVVPTEITTLSNYTLASININISVTHSAFNNNNSEPKNISDSSSMQKTEFYIASSSVSEIFSQELQLNNSIYFQHFWIVTIIKVRNDIDINSFEFKQDMENRLARSYVEAYKRGEHIMNGTYHPLRKKRFAFVKGIALQIMKITHPNHGLSNNVSLVYYMEKNGRPVPVNDAIKHMNLIQLQELAIYLNQVVVLRAESYLKAPHGKYSDNWIIGVVLGSVAVVLLFMWCVLFIFFKCFRRPPLKIQEEKVINIQKIRCNSELLTEDKISKKEKRRSLEERTRLKNQNDDEKHFVNVSQDYVKISLEEMSKPKNTKKGSNKKPCKTITEEQEAPVKNKRQKARLVQSVGYVSSPTKDYDQKSLRFGIFDQNPEESKNNEDISSSCYVNLPPIQSHVSLVATKPKFVKDCYKRRKILQEELQMKQDLSSNELYINVNAECEDTGCSDCGLTNSPNYTRKNNRKVSKQRKCNLKHASDMNTFKESSLNEMYDDHKLWQRQPDTLQRTCVKMHNLLDDAFQLISMNLPQLNVKNISAVDQSNYPRRNVNEKQRHQHHSKSIAEQVLTNRKPFLSESLNEQSHEMQHIPKYSQYQQHCECTPQLGYSRHNNVSPSWHKVGDELNKISSDTQAWIPFMSPNKDCFNHITKHSPKTLMCSTQHFPDNHKENNLIPSMNNFCCSTPPSSNYYVPQLSSPSSYPATKFHLCPHRQVATSLDISSNQLRTVGSKIPNLSSSTKNSNKIGTFQQFPRFPSQTSNSNQSSQQMSQKATDDEIDAIYKNIKPNSPQPLIQSIREELMTTSAYNNEINSFNILE